MPNSSSTPDPLAHSAWRSVVPFLREGKHLPLLKEISARRASGEIIYPVQENILRAFLLTPPQSVRVIILGQDPYHGLGSCIQAPKPSTCVENTDNCVEKPSVCARKSSIYVHDPNTCTQTHGPNSLAQKQGTDDLIQAHGLAFSVPDGVPAPPSLRNIFKEIQKDIYGHCPSAFVPSPNLERWATQGGLLLNTVLTVAAGQPQSHAKLHTLGGWQALTHAVLHSLAQSHPLAVLLWGKFAQSYAPIFDTGQHLVLCAAHPSPLSAARGFLGCGHFSKVNAWLAARGEQGIVW